MSELDSYLGIVIPFARPRQDLLDALPKLKLLKEHILFVRTVDQLQVEDELDCFHNVIVGSEVNIQRWWNLGINFFESRGYKVVMLANDDIIWNLELINQCSKNLQNSSSNMGKVFASNGGQWGHAIFLRLLPRAGKVLLLPTDSRDRRNVLTLPDQTFRWYFGDGDLERQHLRTGSHAVLDLKVDIFHLSPNKNTQSTPQLKRYAKADERKYLEKWRIEKFHRTRTYLLWYRIRLTISKIVNN